MMQQRLLAVVLVAAPAGAAGTLPVQAQVEKLGRVNSPTSCSAAVQPQFDHALALLHSFWFAPAIKGFTDVAQADPSCGIAYWGAAVTWLGNPLAGPPVARGLQEGSAAAAQAKAAGAKTQRELDYIAAIEVFYKDYDKVDHRTRALAYEKAMEARAAERAGDGARARKYYEQLVDLTRSGDTERPEVVQANAFLKH